MNKADRMIWAMARKKYGHSNSEWDGTTTVDLMMMLPVNHPVRIAWDQSVESGKVFILTPRDAQKKGGKADASN